MNNGSGSVLQKTGFLLALVGAAAIGYFVVRQYLRGEQSNATELKAAAVSPETIALIHSTSAPVSAKPNYAPLRPRVETNFVRVGTNRPVLVVDRTTSSTPDLVAAPPTVLNRVVTRESLVPGGALVGGRQSASLNSGIGGRVFLQGNPPPEAMATIDPACGRLRTTPLTSRHYLTGQDRGLANVFVYIKTGAPAARFTVSPPVLNQVGCEYQPYMIGVVTGQTFTVKNSDPVFHNVHALPKSTGNREKNVSQSVKGMTSPFSFAAPELFVQFKCEVHPWMFAYVGVVDHPWFAVTDANGAFSLPPGLPPGNYTLAARHLKAGEVVQQITVTGTGNEPITFTLSVPELAKSNTQ